MTGRALTAPRRMTPGDLARVASVGLRTRKPRASLSALGITIGVAAIVAVLGLSKSSQAGLLAQIDQLGTNVLTVTAGQSLTGQPAELPAAAPAMIGRISGVAQVQDVGIVSSANAYRNPLIPAIETNSLTVDAATLGLPRTVGAGIARGSYLNAATAREPVAVLGAGTAALLGISRVYSGERIWLGAQWFYVAGILHPVLLDPSLDTSVLVGFPAAGRYLGFDGHPSTIYVRTQTSQVSQVDRVQSLLAATADPEDPSQAAVSQPSRSGCAAPSAPPKATSASSSCPNRSSSPSPAASPGCSPAPPPPPATPMPRAGRSSCPPLHGQAESAPPSESAPSPGCSPPSAPPACHPPKRSGHYEPPSQDTMFRHEAMHNSSPGSPAVRLRRACATAAGFLAISLLAAARVAGAIAAVSAFAWFDFFFTQPYERFTIRSSFDITTAEPGSRREPGARAARRCAGAAGMPARIRLPDRPSAPPGARRHSAGRSPVMGCRAMGAAQNGHRAAHLRQWPVLRAVHAPAETRIQAIG